MALMLQHYGQCRSAKNRTVAPLCLRCASLALAILEVPSWYGEQAWDLAIRLNFKPDLGRAISVLDCGKQQKAVNRICSIYIYLGKFDDDKAAITKDSRSFSIRI